MSVTLDGRPIGTDQLPLTLELAAVTPEVDDEEEEPDTAAAETSQADAEEEDASDASDADAGRTAPAPAPATSRLDIEPPAKPRSGGAVPAFGRSSAPASAPTSPR